MSGVINPIYKQLEDQLNAMQKKVNGQSPQSMYRVEADPNFPDRITIFSRDQKQMSLNLSSQTGLTGDRVWMVGSNAGAQRKVISPSIYGNYNRQTGDISYQAYNSSQQLSLMVDQAFRETHGRGADAFSKFNEIMTMGHQGLGMGPASSVPQGWGATQQQAINQIGFRVMANGEQARPDEASMVYRDFVTQFGNAFRPGFTSKPIEQLGKTDAPLGFGQLNQWGYMFNDAGRLFPMPNTNPSMVQQSGQWFLNQNPEKTIKSPSLTFGSDPVSPYRVDSFGIPMPMTPGITTNSSRPSYARSNILMPNEEFARAYERRTSVFDVSPIPGGKIAYIDPNGVRNDIWGRESLKTSQIKGLNLNDLLSGAQRFEMKNFTGREYGGGIPAASFGQFISGDQAQNINVRFGPGTWRASGGGASLNLPFYVDPNTGQFYDRGGGARVPTSQFAKQLQQKTGFIINPVRGSAASLTFGGVLEAASSTKGLGDKTEEVPTGTQYKLNETGQNVSYLNGELKSNAFLYGYYGGLSYGQLSGLATQWQRKSPGYGAAIRNYLRQNYAGVASSGQALGIDFNQMAKAIGYTGGGGGLGLMNQWFSQTIRATQKGSVENTRNLRNYGAGYVGGSAPLGMVHPQAFEEMRRNWPAQGNGRAFDQVFTATPAANGMLNVTQQLSENAMYVEHLQARRMENIHGPRMGLDWLQGLNTRLPQMAEALGLGLDKFQPKGRQQTAAMGLLKYSLWQGERQAAFNAGGGEVAVPENATQISDMQLSQMSAYLNGQDQTGVSAVDRIRGLADRFFGKESGINADALLYNPTVGYIPNPRAVANATFSELGVQSAGVAKPAVEMLSNLGGIVNSGLDQAEMERRAFAAQEGTLAYSQKLITGSGEYFKRLLSKVVDSSVSGRTRASLVLGDSEMHVPQDRAMQVARQLGFRGNRAIQIARQIQNSNSYVMDARQPMQTNDVNVYQNVPDKQYGMRYGSLEAYQQIVDDPRFRGMMEVPYSWARQNAGDYDADPSSAALGIRRVGNNIEIMHMAEAQAALTNAQKISETEQRYFADPTLRNMVNATAGTLQDISAGKDVVGNVLGQATTYDPLSAMTNSISRLMNKTIAMGVGYNPRRAVGGFMSASGYSPQEIAGVMSTIPSMYQPALDTLLKGPESTGVAAASLIANAYFKQENGESYLHLKRTGAQKRTNRVITTPSGETITLPDYKTPAMDARLGDLTSNRQSLFNTTGFIAEAFAQGTNIKGKNVGMSPEQFARWFAAPGEWEGLAAKLNPKDRGSWSQQVISYQGNMISNIMQKGGSLRSGIEAVLSTTIYGALMTRSASKAMNKFNAKTGEEQIPGAMAALNEFAQGMSPAYRNTLRTGVVTHDTEHRAKGLNLSGMFPSNIAVAARNMGNDIKGTFTRAFASALGVPFQSAPKENYTSFSDELPPVDVMFPTSEEKQDGDDSALLQSIVDKQANAQREAMQTGVRPEINYTPEEEALLNNAPAQTSKRMRPSMRRRSASPPSQPPPPQPPAPPAAPPPDDGDPSKRRIPVDQQQILDANKSGIPQRVGIRIRGIAGAVRQYQQGELQRVNPYLDELLTKMGYEGGSSPGEVRQRFEVAYASDRKGILSQISPAMMKQIKGLEKLQADKAYAQFFLDKAQGLGSDKARYQSILDAASDPNNGLEMDIQTAGHIGAMIGNNAPRNPYMAQAALQMAQNPEVMGLHAQLSPFMGGELGAEQMGQIKGILANNPNAMNILRSTRAIKEKPEAIPGVISELSSFSKKMEVMEPGMFKSGSSYGEISTKQADALREAYLKQAEAAKHLTEVTNNQTMSDKERAKAIKEATFDLNKKDAGYRSALYDVLGKQKQGEIDQLSAQMVSGGTLMGTGLTEQLTKAIKQQQTLTGQKIKADEQVQGFADEESAGRFGAAARRMLGGFGLMYIRSIANFATSGLGYGMNERQGLEGVINKGAYGATGMPVVMPNQALALQNMMALNGTNNNPMMGLQQFAAQTPALRDLWTAGSAGLGAWGYAQFAASQLKGPEGAWLSKNSLGIGVGMAALSTIGDVASRTQDMGGLSFRLGNSIGTGGGMPGINDSLAATWTMISSLFSGDKTKANQLRQGIGEQKLIENAFSNNLTRAQFGQQFTSDWWGGTALGSNISQNTLYAGMTRQILEANPNLSQEAAASTASFMLRTPQMSFGDQRIGQLATDYQMGGFSEVASKGLLTSLGFNQAQQYQQINGKMSAASDLQLRFLQMSTSGQMDEARKATIQQGLQVASGMPGLKYMPGVGSQGGGAIDYDKAIKFVEALGNLANSPNLDAFTAQLNAANTQRMAGLQYTMPDINNYVDANGNPISMSPEQITRTTALAGAAQSAAQTRISYASKFADYGASLGMPGLGAGLYDMMMGTTQGKEWQMNRIMNGDPLMLAKMATSGFDLGQLAGPTGVQGNQYNASILANTDISNEGRITGLAWGTTGLRRGSISAQQMGQNIFGNMQGIGVNAAVNGAQLQQPVTLFDGTQVSSVGGQMGLQVLGDQMSAKYQMQMLAFQKSQLQRDTSNQQAIWAVQDQQRALSYGHQMAQFGFQEQGMAIQQESMNANNMFWQQNFGLNQQQTYMQRQWQAQDWNQNRQVRAMQWGWQVQDYQENVRFMTGRDRRLAERDQARQTTMHNIQEDKASRDEDRQRQLWNLEDQRFEIEKNQHAESVKLQQEQFNLQKAQFAENKKYYIEAKALEDQLIKLQRQHWKENNDAAMQQLKITQQYQKDMLELKKTSDQMAIAFQLLNGQMGTFVDDSMVSFQQSLVTSSASIKGYVNNVTAAAQPVAQAISNPASIASASYSNPFAGGTTTSGYKPLDPSTYANAPISTYGTLESYTGNKNIFQGSLTTSYHAEGGNLASSLSQIQVAGERGYEYIVDGNVIPHEASVELARQGLLPGGSSGQAKSAISSLVPQVLPPYNQRSRSGGRSAPQTIIVQVGNRELKRFIVDAVSEEFE